jgi:predicted permease
MRLKHWFYTIPLRLHSLFRRRQVEQELDEELQYHIERQIEENIAKGMTPEEARHTAVRAMGGVEQRKEECRDMRRVRLIEDLMQDLRYGLRTLRKSPGFTVVAAITLALGIGANTAMFNLIDAIILKDLPVRQPEELVLLSGHGSEFPEPGKWSYHGFTVLREYDQVLTGLAAYTPVRIGVSIAGQVEPAAPGHLVSGAYFSVLGVNPILGRLIGNEDDQAPGAHPVAVISHGYWRRRSGVTGLQAVAGLEAPFHQIGDELARFYGDNDPRQEEKLELTTFSGGLSGLRQQFSQPLLILMTVVALVLLIACANVANLLLARASGRRKEIALRLCLGAGRERLIRQLLAESILLAIIGGALGLLFSSWGRQLLMGLISNGLEPISLDVRTDYRVLGFTGGISLFTSILFGLAPALRASRVDLTPALKESARGLSGDVFRMRPGKVLVVTQVALSVMLIAGAGLFVRTLYNLNHQRAGLNPENVMAVRVEPKGSDNKGKNAARLSQIYRTLIDRVTALPGVTSASMSNPSPFSWGNFGAGYEPNELLVDGLSTADQNFAYVAQVYPRYFETLGISLLSGRDIQLTDCSKEAPKVVIISKTLARRLFPNANPLGRQLGERSPTQKKTREFEIVGVVDDVKFSSLKEESKGVIYYPFPNGPTGRGQMTLQVRTSGESSALAAAIRAESQRIDDTMAVPDVRPLSAFIDASVVKERLMTVLLSFFGILATLLAAIGLYGLMAYSVSQRTNEIGIRMALGAQRRNVVALVMRETMLMVVIGVIVGLGAAMGATRLIASLLYGLTPNDPLTIALTAILLLAVAALAGYLPARRAARVDPIVALRHD